MVHSTATFMNRRLDNASPILVGVSVLLGCAVLVALSYYWPAYFSGASAPAGDLSLGIPTGSGAFDPPVAELVKLVAAGLVGLLVTSVHRLYNGDRPVN